ncbi:MAG: DivIVA domain-containing protein [Clostridia bacterium]|nr:DivIVA domain-containing protein [Clostridia bacterium]
MTAPNELKKGVFQKAMRGYNPAEVDGYIEYLIKNYVELYRYNASLEKKIQELTARNAELSRDSETVRTALIDAQRAAAKIVGEAKEEADLIILSSKRSCDNILNEFRVHISEEREKLISLQQEMSSFKERIYAELRDELALVEEMTDRVDWSGIDVDDEIFMKRIITDIKSDVASAMNERSHSGETANYGGPDPEIFDAANKDEKIGVSAAPAAEPEVIDPPEKVADATKIFNSATVMAEIQAAADKTIVVEKIDEIIPETLPVSEVSRIETAAESEAKLSSDISMTEEYDLVLEKFAEELAAEDAEAPAVEE